MYTYRDVLSEINLIIDPICLNILLTLQWCYHITYDKGETSSRAHSVIRYHDRQQRDVEISHLPTQYSGSLVSFKSGFWLQVLGPLSCHHRTNIWFYIGPTSVGCLGPKHFVIHHCSQLMQFVHHDINQETHNFISYIQIYPHNIQQ